MHAHRFAEGASAVEASATPPSDASRRMERIAARGICLRLDEWDYLPPNRRRLSDKGARRGRRSRVGAHVGAEAYAHARARAADDCPRYVRRGLRIHRSRDTRHEK